MKKRTRYVRIISAVGLTVLCLVSLFGLLRAADLLSVRAEETAAVSPADGTEETVETVGEDGSSMLWVDCFLSLPWDRTFCLGSVPSGSLQSLEPRMCYVCSAD